MSILASVLYFRDSRPLWRHCNVICGPETDNYVHHHLWYSYMLSLTMVHYIQLNLNCLSDMMQQLLCSSKCRQLFVVSFNPSNASCTLRKLTDCWCGFWLIFRPRAPPVLLCCPFFWLKLLCWIDSKENHIIRESLDMFCFRLSSHNLWQFRLVRWRMIFLDKLNPCQMGPGLIFELKLLVCNRH